MKKTAVSGSFDDIRLADLKFLKAAAETGKVRLRLWTDEMHRSVYGKSPKFCLSERLYFTESLIYVDEVTPVGGIFDPDRLPETKDTNIWFIRSEDDCPEKRAFCAENNIDFRIYNPAAERLPEAETTEAVGESGSTDSPGKKIIVTGCYDYFHTGHIRFFEEASEYGKLKVVIGSDKNVSLLKGEGHPHYSEDERLFMVRSIKFVEEACISTGSGWMDAEPEIERLRPDIYVVNEDGDKPEKREFCEKHNLQYLILKRVPKDGLPPRTSTNLRGF
ncbi:MAG: adenylyltransferase/cytidyltransferase family protein [Spirochaetales bacterium]|nr:adenylyltransferase/cytidyltransferase family protein [Spirochaetales bacterium]